MAEHDANRGALWRDENGAARLQGVVDVEGTGYAVMLRTRGSGGRKRRPFLFPLESMRAGDDGWTHQPEPTRPDADVLDVEPCPACGGFGPLAADGASSRD